MAYKSIFTVLTAEGQAAAAIPPARAVQQAFEGHLDVLVLAADRTEVSYPVAGMGIALSDIGLAAATELRDRMEAEARARLEADAEPFGLEAVAAPAVSVAPLVAERARMADLVVLTRPYGPGCASEAPVALEAALFQGRAPVLVVPDDAEVPVRPTRALVAWNESPEALTAVRRALPLLRAASAVDVIVIDPGRHAPGTPDPGRDLAQMLARHGVEVTVGVVAQTLPRVSDTVAREVTDRGADLVVMGAYSHSRFREAILGGTTRNLLESASVPILMAH